MLDSKCLSKQFSAPKLLRPFTSVYVVENLCDANVLDDTLNHITNNSCQLIHKAIWVFTLTILQLNFISSPGVALDSMRSRDRVRSSISVRAFKAARRSFASSPFYAEVHRFYQVLKTILCFHHTRSVWTVFSIIWDNFSGIFMSRTLTHTLFGNKHTWGR